MQYLRDVVAQAFFLNHATAASVSDVDLQTLDNRLFNKYERPGFLGQALFVNHIAPSPESKSTVILLAEMLGVQNPQLPVATLMGTAARFAHNAFFVVAAPPPAFAPAPAVNP